MKNHGKKHTKRNFSWVLYLIIAVILIAGIHYVISSKSVLATVNGEKITSKRIDALYTSLTNNTKVTKEQILQQVIDTKVLADYAKVQGYDISDASFNQQLKVKLDVANMTLDQLNSELALHDATLQDVKENMIIESFVKSAIQPSIRVTKQEIEQFKQQYPNVATDDQIGAAIFQNHQTNIIRTIIDAHRKQMQIEIK